MGEGESDFSEEEDDEYFIEFKRKQLEKLQGEQRENEVKEKTFGFVKEITSQDYVAEVNNAGEGITVLLNFYQNYHPKSLLINSAFEELAKEHPKIKFLKTVATKCVEEFPDSNLPYILYYKDGSLQRQVNTTLISIYPKITKNSMEHLFGELLIDGFQKQNK